MLTSTADATELTPKTSKSCLRPTTSTGMAMPKKAKTMTDAHRAGLELGVIRVDGQGMYWVRFPDCTHLAFGTEFAARMFAEARGLSYIGGGEFNHHK